MQYLLRLAAPTRIVKGCADMQCVAPKQPTYREILDAPGPAEEDLWKKSKLWLAQTLKPLLARASFQVGKKSLFLYESKQDGILAGNGSFFYPGTAAEKAHRALHSNMTESYGILLRSAETVAAW